MTLDTGAIGSFEKLVIDTRFGRIHARPMTTILIRDVPDTLHRRLKSRAALAGMSLSDCLLSEIREVAERPTLDELRARLERRSRVTPSVAPAKAIRAERDSQRASPTRQTRRAT